MIICATYFSLDPWYEDPLLNDYSKESEDDFEFVEVSADVAYPEREEIIRTASLLRQKKEVPERNEANRISIVSKKN